MSELTKQHEVQQQKEAVDPLAQQTKALRAGEAARPVAQAAQVAEISEFAEKLKTFAEARTDQPAGARRELDQVQGSIERISKAQQAETSRAAAAASEVVAALDHAVQQLDKRQASTLAAAGKQPGVDLDRLLSDQQRQRDDLAALVERASSVMDLNAQEMRNRQLRERGQLAGLVAGASPSAELGAAAVRSKSESDASVNSQRRVLSFVKAVADEILRRPTAEQMGRLRQQTGIPADQLDDEAVQRIVRAASRERGPADLDAARGQVTEELANRRAQAEVERSGDVRDEFIAGHRIKDGFGRQLTDGLVIRKEADGYRVTQAFEVKAGEPSARGLRAKLERDRSAEVEAVAREAAMEELSSNPRSAELTPAQRAQVHEKALEKMLGADVQRTRGQLEQTAERLSQQRLFIDGAELRQVADEDRHRVQVRAVLAQDTVLVDPFEAKDQAKEDAAGANPVPGPDGPRTDLLRLEQTEQEIEDMARKILAAAAEWRRRP